MFNKVKDTLDDRHFNIHEYRLKYSNIPEVTIA